MAEKRGLLTDLDSEKMRALLKRAWGVAAIAFLLVFSLYFVRFPAGFSANNGDWGTFGDFVGGVLNPFFAFLSFTALLMTIILQSRQLEISSDELRASREELAKTSQALEESRAIAAEQIEHIRNQARKEDALRMVSNIFGDFTAALDRHVHLYIVDGDENGEYKTLEWFIQPLENRSMVKENGAHFTNNWMALIDVVALIGELRTYLVRLEELTGDTSLSSYYKRRMAATCRFMASGNLLTDEALDFFTLERTPS